MKRFRTIQEKADIKQLLQDIKEMKNGEFNQMYLVTIYSLSAYFKSLLAFGSNSSITKDNINIIKEMFNILKVERILLNYIVKNIDEFDVYSAIDVVGMLDEINDKTVEYYYSVINDIEDACETKQEIRGVRPKVKTPTLIQSNSYAAEVIALSENLTNLKDFLGFEEDFWKFIEHRVKVVDASAPIAIKMIYAIPIFDEKELVADVDIMIPKIIDLNTALMAIKMYKKAYEIYKLLGKKYDKESLGTSEELEGNYKNVYLANKAVKILNLKK